MNKKKSKLNTIYRVIFIIVLILAIAGVAYDVWYLNFAQPKNLPQPYYGKGR